MSASVVTVFLCYFANRCAASTIEQPNDEIRAERAIPAVAKSSRANVRDRTQEEKAT
jgi:hypothetical protein